MSSRTVTVVSGLPRSGTSMMMKMIEAGGMEILTDGVRSPDDDNPKGYYELELVKKPETYATWLPKAEGKVVKLISFLLQNLPPDYRYQVVFMERELAEVLASQKQMLLRRGQKVENDDERMAGTFSRHLAKVRDWLTQQPNFDVLYVNHRQVMADPSASAERVCAFLGGSLDAARMVEVVDRALYRQRS